MGSVTTVAYPEEAVPLSEAARYLFVPTKWLRAEAEAGRVPCLRADTAILIHVPTVAEILRERAKANGGAAT